MLLDIVYTVIFVLLSLLVAKLLLRESEAQYRRPLNWLIIYHFIFAVIFYLYVTKEGGDALGYWSAANKMSFSDFKMYILEGVGTRFMESFNYIPVNIMGMSFFANSMLYGFIGSVGLSFFYVVALRTIPFNVRVWGIMLFPYIFLLPNLHFWSAGVGKDTLVFFGIGMFMFALLQTKKHIVLLVISLLIMFAVRPHIVLILLAAVGMAYFFDAKIVYYKKIFITIVFLVLGIVLLPKVLEFVSIDSLSFSGISKRSELQAKLLTEGSGSAVDISSYPLVYKVFTFLYRPFFLDINSPLAGISAIENLILIILSIKVLLSTPLMTFKNAPPPVRTFMFFLLIGTFLFAQTLGNLGIMIRMRNMFLPGFLIYFLWSFSFSARRNGV